VVLFHVYTFTTFTLITFPRVPGLDLFLRSGSTGVSLFLILSGFCLYAPFAAGGERRFRTGRFLVRRFRRLMPAYYVGLALALALNVLGAGRLGFSPMTPSEVGRQLLTHLTMTQSLFPDTFYGLNGAFWSLALEWQLYLLLPLLVWGVRRFGLARTGAVVILSSVAYRVWLALAIDHGLAPHASVLAQAVLPNLVVGRSAEFMLGMIAAEAYASGRLAALARRLRYGALILVPATPLVAAGPFLVRTPLAHLVFGAMFFILLCAVLASGNIVNRLVSWPPLVFVGVISYSLYLVHQPLVQMLAYLVRTAGVRDPVVEFFVVLGLLPLVVVVAWPSSRQSSGAPSACAPSRAAAGSTGCSSRSDCCR
jgi:peptidoglycan/LPS O-acetylase OafA/YrhL